MDAKFIDRKPCIPATYLFHQALPPARIFLDYFLLSRVRLWITDVCIGQAEKEEKQEQNSLIGLVSYFCYEV